MEEIGIVSKVSDRNAIVKVKRHTECSKCGLCGMKENVAEIDFIAGYGEFDKEKISVGDKVKITNLKDVRLTSYMVLFITPVLLIVASILIGCLFFTEMHAIIASFTTVILWFGVVFIVDRYVKFSKKYGYHITTICEKAKTIDNNDDTNDIIEINDENFDEKEDNNVVND